MTFAKWTRLHFKDDAETWSASELALTLNGWEQRTSGEAVPPVLITEPLSVSQNQRGEVVMTDYAHQLTAGGGKPGEGYPAVLVSEPMAVMENQRAEVRLQEYTRAVNSGGGKAGQGYQAVLVDEPMGLTAKGNGEAWLSNEAPGLNAAGGLPGQGYPAVLTSSTEDSPARMSAWPVTGPVYPASAAVSGMSSTGCCASCGHDGQSLRMFPDSFPQEQNRAPTSVSYSGGWSTSGMAWPGGFWTRVGSESPSVAVVSSLSAVLETRHGPRRYWLSARAAAGILRRAEKRGKTLPPRLMTALVALASNSR